MEPRGTGGGRGRGRGSACAAPAVLAHISVLLAAYGGAMLATGARLKWDPSTYIALRELLPALYRAAAALLPCVGAALLALCHLALAALTVRGQGTKRALWLIYLVCTVAMVAAEVAFVAWAALRVQDWLQSDAAQHLRDTAEIKEHLVPLLSALERWLPLPARLRELVQEAEADAPWNGYVAGAAGAALLAAQLAAALCAGLARAGTPAPPTGMRAYKDNMYYGAVAQNRMQSSSPRARERERERERERAGAGAGEGNLSR